MNTSYITQETWARLFKEYPEAFGMMLHENLKEEYRQLEREYAITIDPRRSRWIENRLGALKEYAPID